MLMLSVADTLLMAWPKVGSFGPTRAHVTNLKHFTGFFQAVACWPRWQYDKRQKEGKKARRKKDRKKARKEARSKHHVRVIRVA